MIDGKYTYYTFQQRTTHKSPWLKPNEPLEPVEKKNWSFGSWDYFGYVAEPWHGSGNDYRPKYKKAHDETHDVWSKTGSHGWWTLDYAIKGLKRLQKGDAEGKFDSRDGYRNHCQAVRHEFRLVVVTVSRKVEEVTVGHIVEAAK